MENKVYLDNAASTNIDKRVLDKIYDTELNIFANPSSIHSLGQKSKSLIENCRKIIANLFNIDSQEIIFTSGGTESNNLILRSCVEDLGVKKIISSKIEHKSVNKTIELLKKEQKDLEVISLDVSKKGEFDLDYLEKILINNTSKKTLLSIMHSNNEIGNIYDIAKISSICKKQNTLFHSDTVQSIAHLRFDLNILDFASCSAHKFHGPKGIGFAYIKKNKGIKGKITGGNQEKNLRAGTENISSIVGMTKALELGYEEFEKRKKIIQTLKSYTLKCIKKAFPDIIINGLGEDFNKSLHTILNIQLPFKNELIGFELDMKGICVSQGSACNSGASKHSDTILSIYSNRETILEQTSTIRISFSHNNTEKDIDKLISALVQIQKK